MARVKKGERAATASDRASAPAPAAAVGYGEVASRAYDLYLARGCEHGRDLDDWLQAERELRSAPPRAPAV